MNNMLLEMKNIHKKFPGVYALQGVNLCLERGEVLALVGENGAGKSTLINILGGIHQKDSGEIIIDGKTAKINSVLEARDLGISIIHQELVLVPHLSVAENIYLNREPTKNGFVDYDLIFRNAQKFVDDLGLDIDVNKAVMELTIAQQQIVEIIKAVSFQSKIIVMDEPTSSLSDTEIEVLFKNVNMLKERGIGIIYISHRLSELQIIADRVTILRDGSSVSTMKISETNNDEIVKHMVGREMTNYYTRNYYKPGKVVLEARGLCSNKIKNVDFDISEGEILGFAGLVGAGRTEAIKAVLGFDKLVSGEVVLDGKCTKISSPSAAYKLGIGYIPENRREEGIIPLQTLRFNVTLKVLKEFIKGVFNFTEKEIDITDEYINLLDIKTSSQLALIQNLSGGNQQKAVIASWLATKPKLLIMDEPTRGIDVGAKAEIYALMDELAKNGIAIIMISSELPEVINMSDRVVVMRNGTVSAILNHSEATQEEIMKHAISI